MTDAKDPIARLKDKIRKAGWALTIDETLAFGSPVLQGLLDLWREKSNAIGALPSREDLDVRLLKPFLRHITIVERVPDSLDFRIRLQGSALVEYFGDHTGKRLEDAMPPDIAQRWTAASHALIETRQPLRLIGSYSLKTVNYLLGESLSVPLGNGAVPPISVLSATYFMPKHRA